METSFRSSWPPVNKEGNALEDKDIALNKQESQESQEQKLERDLKEFIQEYKVPIEIKRVIHATPEQKKQAQKLRDRMRILELQEKKLHSDVDTEIAMTMLDYVDQAIIEDNITKPEDDSIRDIEIENRLLELATKDGPDRQKYVELQKFYTNNRLHRNTINRNVSVYTYYLEEDESLEKDPQTLELYEKIKSALDVVEVKVMQRVRSLDGNGNVMLDENKKVILEDQPREVSHMIPKYDFMTNDEKIEVANTTSEYVLSAIGDVVRNAENKS